MLCAPGCRMWERAIVLLLAAVTVPDSTSCASQNMRVGVAINLFSRYGYLSISMRVVPRNDSDPWLFREPSVDVFRNLSYLQTPVRGLPGTGTPVFQGDFHMEFCDNMKQLLQVNFCPPCPC
uniref:Uncharacterized protein n=1 Tax=Timema monikensis TaxID=170555 RepID=A0A7R9EDF2_9NEOP|nr:unnamed protein product [Timema monikensis]